MAINDYLNKCNKANMERYLIRRLDLGKEGFILTKLCLMFIPYFN